MSSATKGSAEDAKERLVAVRLSAAELAGIDAAVARFKDGALAPSRSQMIRLGLALGLERLSAMSPEELGRVLLGVVAAAPSAKSPARK